MTSKKPAKCRVVAYCEDCPYFEHYDIHYTEEQFRWLLCWKSLLEQGEYPQNPKETGYTDVPIGSGSSEHAPFEKAIMISAEMNERLSMIKQDRYLVEDKYCAGLNYSDIARKIKVDEDDVFRLIESALVYIASGTVRRWQDTEKRKGMSYKDWKAQGRARRR